MNAKRSAATSGEATARTYDKHGTEKPTGGRSELQGVRTGRSPTQPAPSWQKPAGSDAADALERALAGWTALLGKPRIPTRGSS